jgi:ABC-type uncharacterized transport system fused permease/ATPase subunit
MNTQSRKLHELENNIINFKVEDGSTIISSQCMNPGEIELYNQAIKLENARKNFANELLDKLENNQKADLSGITKFFTEEEKAIVDASQKMYLLRALDVMNVALFQYIHLNQPLQKRLFYLRFRWFLDEMQEWLWYSYLEQSIFEDKNMCEGEKEQLLKKQVYKNWRKWLSAKSFQKWMKKNDTSLFKKIEDLLPEELEEMEKREAELEAKYRNEDLAEIKGRCAKCTDKCIWYRQRKIELNIQ